MGGKGNCTHLSFANLRVLQTCFINASSIQPIPRRIIIGSDRRPETKQGIGGKIVRFRSGRVRDRVRDKDRRSKPERRCEAINFGAC